MKTLHAFTFALCEKRVEYSLPLCFYKYVCAFTTQFSNLSSCFKANLPLFGSNYNVLLPLTSIPSLEQGGKAFSALGKHWTTIYKEVLLMDKNTAESAGKMIPGMDFWDASDLKQ